MTLSLCLRTVTELSALIASREVSPVQLTTAYLQRIEGLDPQLNAFITVAGDHALRQARQAEAELLAGRWRGPLHGIPFGLKDMFNTAGIRTTANSRLLAENIPIRDATAVTRLYGEGAVLLGKNTTHEFAHGGPSFDLPWPPARNPWQTDHFTGGSSSGTAAAVAAGLMAFGLGTDTGGSLRSPACLCGIVGMKPSFGLVSRTGVIPFSDSCDHVGPIARSVEDCAILVDALAGHDRGDKGSADVPPPRCRAALTGDIKGISIGILRHFWEEDAPVAPQLAQALERAIGLLQELGATVEEVRLRPLNEFYAIRIMLTESELFARHLDNLRSRPGAYGRHFLSRVLPACLFTAADYLAAQRERTRIIAEMQPIYERYDVLLTAGGGPAPSFARHSSLGNEQKWTVPSLSSLFTLTGAPAVAMPCGFSQAGLPLGMQLAGRPFEDATVLKVAHAYERATGWKERRPDLRGGTPLAPIEIPTAVPREAVAAAVTTSVKHAVERAGLQLPQDLLALLCEVAPHAIDLAGRIAAARSLDDIQANGLCLEIEK